MCVHVCMCVYVCMHVCTCVCMCVCGNISLYSYENHLSTYGRFSLYLFVEAMFLFQDKD